VEYVPIAVRLQYKDADEASGTRSFIRYLYIFLWLPKKDSNPRLLIQSCSWRVPTCTSVSGNCMVLQAFMKSVASTCPLRTGVYRPGFSKWLFSKFHPVRAEPAYDESYNAVSKL
jgi:hypothetical protein